MHLEQSSTDEKILKEPCGDPPEARKKKHAMKDRRTLYAVERYDPETVQLVEYLDSLRNVMCIFKYQCILSVICTRNISVLCNRKCSILYD